MHKDSTNEGEEGDSVFKFFCSFEKSIMQNEDLRTKLKHYFNGNSTTKASYAEIYKTTDEMRIKTETSIERLVLTRDAIKQADNITGMINHTTAYSIPNTFSQSINLNSLSSSIFESAINEKSTTLIEIKINKDLYKSEAYVAYMSDKIETQTSFLIPEVSRLGFPNYFYYDEIDIEFSSLNNYLFQQLSHYLTMMSIKGKYSLLSKVNLLSLPCLIKLINNCQLLTALNYFHDLSHSRLRLGDHKAMLSKFDWLDKINSFSSSSSNSTGPISNTCFNGDNKQMLLQEKMLEDIKSELVAKEQLLTKMIVDSPHHYDKYTHFYINDHTMTEQDVKNVGAWLIHSKVKLFAWHLNQEDTKRIGLKAMKVGTIPKLNHLNIYLKLK